LTERYRDHCEDRVNVIHEDERTVIVVADGAGGVGSGDLAAETVIREVENDFRRITSENDWETELRQIDCRIGVGESTGVVVVDLRPDGIVGASVGDSQAWIVHAGELLDLTASQIRKPLLGTGEAKPKGFVSGPLVGVLIVATDGFYNYVKRDQLAAMIPHAEFVEIPRKCVEMASGDLWDDIGIACCRVPRPRRARKRYTI
jgi:serine/threonine protein phosphatase PrpC